MAPGPTCDLVTQLQVANKTEADPSPISMKEKLVFAAYLSTMVLTGYSVECHDDIASFKESMHWNVLWFVRHYYHVQLVRFFHTENHTELPSSASTGVVATGRLDGGDAQ